MRNCTYRAPRQIEGVYTTFFDTLHPIPRHWLDRAYRLISNWNTDGSSEISGYKATSAHVTPTEIILYTFGGREIFRLTKDA